MSSLNWRHFTDASGDFEFPNYIFRVITDLMKESLDLGTLLSDDPAKLRAYKEQVKKYFKSTWMDVAEALEFFDLVVRCSCSERDFCEICGGSRYVINPDLNSDLIHDVGMVIGASAQAEVADKLQKGLQQILREVSQDEMPNMH